jgi:hypothetical protein
MEDKKCKKFCKEVFLPERERVEIEFSKKLNMPNNNYEINKNNIVFNKKYDLVTKSINIDI